METKPNYVLVGIFTLGFLAFFIIITLWLYRYKSSDKYDTYLILTSQSVNGLSQGSAVKYKGVDIGSVEKIDIDPDNPELVRIFVDIKHNIPVKEDTTATISPQGLTGLSFVDLSGGSKNSPLLRDVSKSKYPVIKLKPSELEQISKALPEILSKANRLIDDMDKTFNNKNRKNISDILNNLNKVSTNLSTTLNNLNNTINNANSLIYSAKDTSKNANNTIKSLDNLIKSLKQDTNEFYTLSSNINNTINQNKGSINNFTKQDIPKIEKLIHDIDITTKSANTLINELKENPSYLIYGKPKTPAPTEEHKP